MRRVKIAEIPPSGGFSLSNKTKILSSLYAFIPQEYVESLPGIDDAHFGAMQSLVMDVSS